MTAETPLTKTLPGLPKAFWRRAMLLQLFLCGLCAVLYPVALRSFLLGIGLGALYWVSLLSFRRPAAVVVQLGLSIVRMLILAYLIAYSGNFKVAETMIVICGFLSYKMVLIQDQFFYVARTLCLALNKQGRQVDSVPAQSVSSRPSQFKGVQ